MTARPPNVLMFMTDQQRGSTVLPGDSPRAVTPNLDALRTGAATFSRAFAPSPHCCPSRASLFTGLYPSEHGVLHNVTVANAISRRPRDGTPFWSRDLAAAGYRLAYCGKWHVSNTDGPAEFGWRELLVSPPVAGTGMSPDEQRRLARRHDLDRLVASARPPSNASTRRPGTIDRPGYPPYRHYGVSEDPFDDRRTIEIAIAHLREQARRADRDAAPWCLYVGTLGPHDPYLAPQRFLDLYPDAATEMPASFTDPMSDKPALYRRTRDRFDQLTEYEQRQALRHYLALCSYEDHLLGLVLAELRETGQFDRTVVVYLSDHGDYTGEHGLWGKGLPAFQPAYHVPMVISTPQLRARHHGVLVDDFVSLLDIGPTVLELCDVRPGSRMSGASLVPFLDGRRPPGWREAAYFQTNGNELYGIQRTVVTEDWKLVVNLFDYDELYDLRHDPSEMVNLLHPDRTERRLGVDALVAVPVAHRETVARLYRMLWAHALAHDDDVLDSYILTALATYGPQVGLPGTDAGTGPRPPGPTRTPWPG